MIMCILMNWKKGPEGGKTGAGAVRASGGGIPAGLTEGPMLILDDGEETPDAGCQINVS
jgi:hypothetical protein